MHTHAHSHAQTQIKLLILLGPLTVAYGNKPTQQKDNMWTHTPAHTQAHMEARTQISNAYLKPAEDTFWCKPWWRYRINERMNSPWLGLRAMLPEFKASSKRLNIVCNLEAETKKGQSTANLRKWNEHIQMQLKHAAWTRFHWQRHDKANAHTRRAAHEGDCVETATRLWGPFNQQQHVDSWFCRSACLMAGGCV